MPKGPEPPAVPRLRAVAPPAEPLDPEEVPQSAPSRSGAWNVPPELLRKYLPLVRQVVGQLARRLPANVLRDDLMAAGVFGLMDSLRKNGADCSETFEWYARTRIRGAIFDELRAQDWLPRRARSAASSPEPAGLWAGVVAVGDIGGLELAAMAELQEDPTEKFEARSVHRALVRAIERLPERERRIVGLYYFQGVKFKDIGAQLGVSEPRISQLHARAIERLRGLLDAA